MQLLSSAAASDKFDCVERLAPPSSLTLPSSTAVRLRHLANHLHRLGPRPLYEILAEAVQGAPLIERLERYALLDPETVRALGGDTLAPTIIRIK
jgi:hypothetical protein